MAHTSPPTATAQSLLAALVEGVDKIHAEQLRHYEMHDEAIGAYLNARFPYGQGTDRWSRRR